MAKPKRLIVVNGKRQLVDFDSRKEEYQDYNRTRWKHQNDLMRFYNCLLYTSDAADEL